MMDDEKREPPTIAVHPDFNAVVSLLPQMKQKPPGKHTGRMAPAEQAIGAAGTALGAGGVGTSEEQR